MSAETTAADEWLQGMMSDFLDEAGSLLISLNEDLLTLEAWTANNASQRSPLDPELMNNMFRSAHSLKGLSAMLGLTNINQLTHRIENVFDASRKGQLDLTSSIVETIFQSIDALTAMIAKLQDDGSDQYDASAVMLGIEQVLESGGCARQQTSQADAEKALAACEQGLQLDAALDSPARVEPAPKDLHPEVAALEQIVDETDIPPKYLAIFIDETDLALESLAEVLLCAERSAQLRTVEELLVTAHRIKGSAASLGLNRTAKLAHWMEDALQTAGERKLVLPPSLIDALLHCVDALRLYVTGLKQSVPDCSQFASSAAELLVASNEAFANCPPIQVEPPAIVTAWQPQAIAVQLGELETGTQFSCELHFEANLPLVGLKANLAYEKAVRLGQILHCDPTAESLEEIEQLESLRLIVQSEASRDEIAAALNVNGVRSVDVRVLSAQSKKCEDPAMAVAQQSTHLPTTTNSAKPTQSLPAVEDARPSAAEAKSKATDEGGKPSETLRVDIDRLDQLMNLAGQLVISKARFSQIGTAMRESLPAKQLTQVWSETAAFMQQLADDDAHGASAQHAAATMSSIRSHARRLQSDIEKITAEFARVTKLHARVSELFEAVHQLDRVAASIQKSVMDTRMVPVGPLFNRFKRVVRDITRLNGKDIRLVIRGESTELDKRMIDELGDPLIHMVRNSADHGIESPEARVATGKAAQGTITLDAFHRGNSIVIQVSDDGKGLDRDRILRKGVERGLVDAETAERMTAHQVFQLIWEPGFSTAEKVTEISGRGMGMDIVRSKIEGLSGTVEVESNPGQGTVFTIKLPLTLAIMPSLMAEIDGDVIALPIESIAEIVGLKDDSLGTVHGLRTATIRGRVVSVVELKELLTWNSHSSRTQCKPAGDHTIVVIRYENREIGLLVDTVLGEEDVVIKSLADNYRNVEGVAGASILGDGRVSLILDVGALVNLASRPVVKSGT
ncbi:Chemotaxis protein CheA [Anatilimnocola aggregata]|uniref:Chemotaxis protein CheA n=1 Tax=Anatilimnocola aggregata TaxID=2528021 RepID=A0A517YK23_9BACT|nr:chemotaxis protein CheA [Anatilimnocola aggregata]QDU30571.1 Chemotaxis protein CheA [Anatilimnocola aggregata]